jgi:hypothetical protein
MVLAPTLLLNAGSGAIVRPTFSRDFAGEKTLDNGTGPSITFTRASDATYFDADGVLQTASSDTPRFDHSGGNSLGLLIEESRQNLLQRSAEFDNAYWTKANATVTANAVTAPDGTTTADAVFETADSGFHAIQRGLAIPSTAIYTASLFVKANGRTQFAFQIGLIYAEFNLSAGTAAVIGGGASDAASILALPNGWYRCTFTRSATADETVFMVFNNGSVYDYTGDAALGFYIWGAQLEAGAFPTSYIPTTSAAVTRSADSAIVNPISSFYNASEGTLFAEFSRYSIAGSGSLFVADNETIGNRVGLFGTVAQVAISDVFTTIDAFSVVAGTVYRGILGYKANDHAATLNGAAVDTNTAVGVPTAATHLRLGAEAFAGGELNGHIRRIAYFPKRLSNALLQSLTT